MLPEALTCWSKDHRLQTGIKIMGIKENLINVTYTTVGLLKKMIKGKDIVVNSNCCVTDNRNA